MAKRREKRASYFYDMSKIIMGGTVISFVQSIIVDGVELSNLVLYTIIFGFIATVFTALVADRLMEY